MAFGEPARYIQLALNRIPAADTVTDGRIIWDKAIEKASDEYKNHTVIILKLCFLEYYDFFVA